MKYNLTIEDITFLRAYDYKNKSNLIENLKKSIEYTEEENIKEFLLELINKINYIDDNDFNKIDYSNFLDIDDIEE